MKCSFFLILFVSLVGVGVGQGRVTGYAWRRPTTTTTTNWTVNDPPEPLQK